MPALRQILRSRPLLAALIFTAAVLMRVAVPAGMMPDIGHGTISLRLCDGQATVHDAAMPAMPGMTRGEHGPSQHQHQHNTAPCDFAALGLAHTGGADPIRLTLALAFIVAAAVLAYRPLLHRRTTRLRPPLRGPPQAG